MELSRSAYGLCPASTQIMLWCFIPYNKSFIDQACSVKMAGYWPSSYFACLWTETKSCLVNNPYICHFFHPSQSCSSILFHSFSEFLSPLPPPPHHCFSFSVKAVAELQATLLRKWETRLNFFHVTLANATIHVVVTQVLGVTGQCDITSKSVLTTWSSLNVSSTSAARFRRNGSMKDR